jgi:hypothetical protein
MRGRLLATTIARIAHRRTTARPVRDSGVSQETDTRTGSCPGTTTTIRGHAGTYPADAGDSTEGSRNVQP